MTRRAVTGALLAAAALGWRMHPTMAQEDAKARIGAMPLRERVARMFMAPITGVSLSDEDAAMLRAVRPGGVILVGENFGTPEEVRALVAAIHATNPDRPPLVALDQEGGIVSRIADDPAPGAPTMGTLPLEEIARLARLRAETLAGYGFDVNFAPVADVAFSPDSFMAGRAFGSDPEQVAADVVAYLQGVAGIGVAHCVKHFPGHGRVAVDSHEALPTLTVDATTWWEADALPFRAAVDAGVPMVMLGHLDATMWGGLPASLSPVAVQSLRADLGFGGAIVTDDLGMGALSAWGAQEVVDLAVAAGVDLLLYVIAAEEPATLVDHVVSRVEQGEVAEERIDASVARVMALSAGE
jgi:beta-N-acetylhexosaminidase